MKSGEFDGSERPYYYCSYNVFSWWGLAHRGSPAQRKGEVIRKALALLFGPFWRFIVRHVPVDDPWERLDTRPALHMFGSGARLDLPQAVLNLRSSNPMSRSRMKPTRPIVRIDRMMCS